MKIALIGYGKMGKAIETIALNRGHEIVLKIGIENVEEMTDAALQRADVAIEFSGPEAAFENITTCLKNKLAVVSGSTGWLKQYDDAVKICKENDAAFLYASNFSLGVNLFFELNEKLAQMMAPYNQYDVTMTEIHHTAKLDAPSGTAITLAQQIIQNYPAKTSWVNEPATQQQELYIESKRIDPAPGTHTIKYQSAIDTITIEHEAHSREGFALGAVVAAEFLAGKKGVFTMKDVLAGRP